MGWPALADNVFFEQLHFSVRKFLLYIEGKSVFLQLCRTYWFFLVLLSGVILNKSNFLFHTWSPWDFFKDSYHISQVFRLKILNIFNCVSLETVLRLFPILVTLLSMIQHVEVGTEDDLIGAFKCRGNCHTEEAGKIFAITTETRDHRLILWLKRFRCQETCLNLMDWDSAKDFHGQLRDLLP